MERTREVLVVEDEKNIRELVCLHLELEGYHCVPVEDGKEAMTLASDKPFDLIIMDLMLPSMDGVSITRSMRRHGPNQNTPILMLTARREEADKVMGLDSGADDYLTKPFGVDELLARMRVALRRAARVGAGASRPILEAGALRIDLERHEVTRAGAPVRLTPIEYRILVCLAGHPGRVFTHGQLVKSVWSGVAGVAAHHVRVHMAELRKKIEDDPARPKLLITEPGVGYRLKD